MAGGRERRYPIDPARASEALRLRLASADVQISSAVRSAPGFTTIVGEVPFPSTACSAPSAARNSRSVMLS